jgi:hypothetical protein
MDGILALREPLEVFARSVGQPDSLHWMHYFLHNRKWWCRRPYLVLVRKAGTAGRPVQADDLEGAALFFEYGNRFLRTWAFVGDNLAAPEAERGRISALALQAMLDCGAHAIVSTHWREPSDRYEPGRMLEKPGMQWAQRARTGARGMRLGTTFEETLALFGKSTRFNFRYYRKRFEEKVASEYIGDARETMSLNDLLALNAACRNPVDTSECRLRYENSVHRPGGFLSGLRDEDGKWISAIGGWRSGTTAVIHWQANLAQVEKDSLVTVMRAKFLQYEVEQGTRELRIFGGTSHSMGHAFAPEVPFDTFVRRRSKRAFLLWLAGQLFARPNLLVRDSNFLAAGLCADNLEWNPSHPRPVAELVHKQQAA